MLHRAPFRIAIFACLALALAAAADVPRQDARPLSPDEIRALVDRAITNQHRNDDALAESQGILRVGIIILLDETLRAAEPHAFRCVSPRLDDVIYDLRCLNSWISVPIWAVALR